MCPEGGVLSAYLDGEVSGKWRAAVAEHLAACPACAARLERMAAVRDSLRNDREPDVVDVMVRVRNALGSRRPALRKSRPIAVPVPLAAVAAGLIVLLGAALVLTAVRPWDTSSVRITASPTGLRQFEIRGDAEDIRRILEVLNEGAAERSVTIDIPKDFRFAAFGEPELRPALQRSTP